MTTLADSWDGGGGEWLGDGWHTVTVIDYRSFEFNTGSEGVEFVVANDMGRKAKASFQVTNIGNTERPYAISWKLTNFAKACGFTKEQAGKYDLENQNCHSMLVGKKLQVLVIAEGKYHKVDTEDGDMFYPIGELVPVHAPPRAAETAPPTAPDDDIPF